jgi:hypothetical protein
VEVFAEIPSGSGNWKFLKSASFGNTDGVYTFPFHFILLKLIFARNNDIEKYSDDRKHFNIFVHIIFGRLID